MPTSPDQNNRTWVFRLFDDFGELLTRSGRRRRSSKREKGQDKSVKKTQKKNSRRNWRGRVITAIAPRVPVSATILMIVFSTVVAIPAQLIWFDEQGLTPIRAAAAAGMLEGATWFAAILYYRSVQRDVPNRMFRVAVLAFAAMAAGINFQHGAETNTTVGVVYALGSLLGVGAWEMYIHDTRTQRTGMTGEEIRMWALRWRRHPFVMRKVFEYRAQFGNRISLDTAWYWAWLSKRGQLTIPVATSHPLVQQLLAPQPAPAAAGTEPGPDRDQGGTDTAPLGEPPELADLFDGDTTVAQLPINLDDIANPAELFEKFGAPDGWDQSGPGGGTDSPDKGGTTVAGPTPQHGGPTPGTGLDESHRDPTGTEPGPDRDQGGTQGWDSRVGPGVGPALTSEVPPAEGGTGTTGTDRSHPADNTGSQGGTEGGPTPGTKNESHPPAKGSTKRATKDDTDTFNRKQLLVYRYFELRRSGVDVWNTDAVNKSAEAKTVGCSAKYVRNVWEQCDAGKHPDPFEQPAPRKGTH